MLIPISAEYHGKTTEYLHQAKAAQENEQKK